MARKEIVYTSVKMDDGRIVEFAGTRQLSKESIIADGKVQVRLDFLNGETRLFTVPDAMLLKFAAHGASQKLGDEISGVKDMDDGILAIDDLMDRLNNGDWGVKREVSGLAGTSILARALLELSGKPVAEIRAFLAAKTQGEKIALRQNPALMPIIARMEGEKTKKASTIDTTAMLGGLMGSEPAAEVDPADATADGEAEAAPY